MGIWGDSITFGACDATALGWPGRLRKVLPDDDATNVYNFGICGETSADVLKRFQVEFDAIDPDVVMLAFGINDSKFLTGATANLVPLRQYRENLQQLIAVAKKTASEIVLIGPTAVGKESSSSRGSIFQDKEIVRYRDVLEAIAKENNLTFIDMFNVLDPAADLADGVHPTTAGYQKMFEAIQSKVGWF